MTLQIRLPEVYSLKRYFKKIYIIVINFLKLAYLLINALQKAV